MAAAISDFRPHNVLIDKKHRGDASSWSLELVPNPDIAERLGKKKDKTFLVGFSLETDNDDARSLEKMIKKNCDMMIVNRADVALESDSSAARILFPDKPAENAALQGKNQLAALIIKRIATSMGLS
jgi:phosphopantothenoylcysteine decarboxylase/phosphopantothenate--cysteine ligase